MVLGADDYAVVEDRAAAVDERAVFCAVRDGAVLVSGRPRSVVLCTLMPCMCARRIIGVQSFSGSFRRSCYLLPTLGQDEIQLDQQCGGYVDSGTLVATGYVALDGTPQEAKGYICPLGQVCKVRERRKLLGRFVFGIGGRTLIACAGGAESVREYRELRYDLFFGAAGRHRGVCQRGRSLPRLSRAVRGLTCVSRNSGRR